MISVRLFRPLAVVGVAVTMTLALGACSSSPRGAGTAAASPSGSSATSSQSSQSSPSAQSATAGGAGSTPTGTPGAPITVTGASGAPGTGTPAGDASGAGTATPSSATADSSPALPAASVTATPKLGSTAVAPSAAIEISVHGGTLTSLTFTNPAGRSVKGTLSPDRTTWTLGEPLGFGTTYTVAGVAVNADGVRTAINSRYVTATTVEPVTTSISPGDGAVVGVAAPIIVRFGMNPQDKALIERHMRVVTTPKVTGSWAWITHDGDSYPSLDWRPEKYWPSGTKVHVESNIYGVKFADGWYGGDSRSVDFTIGRNQVVVANAKTHMMTVQRDGKTVATYPASLGMGDDPNGEYGLRPSLVTRSGIHIVMDKTPKILMSNPGYYKNVPEYWAVRISDNGEFIHYNEGTTSDELGHVNKTHGCINLSEQDAQAYYATAIYGDPVDVVGTSVTLGPSDGDVYDWAIPWSTWQTYSALSKASIWT